MIIEYHKISSKVKLLKDQSSRNLQIEFTELKKRYWSHPFLTMKFGCWSRESITDKMVNEYNKQQKKAKQ